MPPVGAPHDACVCEREELKLIREVRFASDLTAHTHKKGIFVDMTVERQALPGAALRHRCYAGRRETGPVSRVAPSSFLQFGTKLRRRRRTRSHIVYKLTRYKRQKNCGNLRFSLSHTHTLSSEINNSSTTKQNEEVKEHCNTFAGRSALLAFDSANFNTQSSEKNPYSSVDCPPAWRAGELGRQTGHTVKRETRVNKANVMTKLVGGLFVEL